MDNSEAVNILLWNARSIRYKTDELLALANNTNIDIILISETHLKPSIPLRVPGFEIHRDDRLEGAGGGTAIFVRQSIASTRIPTPKLKYTEATIIEVKIEDRAHTIIAAYCNNYRNLVREDLNKLINIGPIVVLGGDLNAKHNFWNNYRGNANGKTLFTHMQTYNYTIMAPDRPTHHAPTTKYPSTLDIVLEKNASSISPLRTLDELSSDHLPVSFTIGGTTSRSPRKQRNYKDADWDGFKQEINERIHLTSGTLRSAEEIDAAASTLTEIIQHAQNTHIPLKEVHTYTIKLPEYVLSLIKEKNRLRRIYHRTRDGYFKTAFNILQREIKDEITTLRRELWTKKVTSLTPKDNSLWKMAKALRHQDHTIPPLEKLDGSGLALSLEEKANALADGFERAYAATDGLCDPETDRLVEESLQDLNQAEQTNIADIHFSTPSEIAVIIKRLKTNKAPGSDQIHNILLKHLPQKAIIFITKLFNACLITGHFPQLWKTATVLPFSKPNKDKKLPTNYRPISLLSTLSKVFEQVILNRLVPHHEQNKTLPDEQFGFRKRHSTTHQLTRVAEFIARKFNEYRYVAAALIDLEKAFDTVWIRGLLHKLHRTNTPVYLTRLIQEYLRNRTFRVFIRNVLSSLREIPKGVPQGSLLGPILFNIFTHDIPRDERCKKSIYADDVKLYVSSLEAEMAAIYLQRALDALVEYYKKWRLKLNEAKTEAIMYTRKRTRRTPAFNIEMGGHLIDWKEEVVYLGLTMDSRLDWKSHVAKAQDKARKAIGAMKPIFNRRSPLLPKTKLLIYYSLIRPVLTYAIPVWSSISHSDHMRLQVLQNYCIKITYNTRLRTNLKKLHDNEQIPTLFEYTHRLTDRFYKSLRHSKNSLIREIGQYNSPSDFTFRYTHRLPKHILMDHNQAWFIPDSEEDE